MMAWLPYLIALGVLVGLGGCAVPMPTTPGTGGATATGFILREIEVHGERMPYAVYVPRGYDPSHAWPLVVFLHGSGESGTDGQKMIAQGIGTNLLWNADRWPCVVVLPQKPSEKRQWEAHDEIVMAIVERTRREYSIDSSRMVLTGLSQGGHGTWVLGARHPEAWSALVPICGYPEPMTAEEIAAKARGIPVWAFHGEADDVVPVGKTTVVVEAIRAAGGEAKLTTYPGVGHGSWDRAYGEEELARWMMGQRRR